MNPLNGCDVDDLSVGMRAETAKTIAAADLVVCVKIGSDGEETLLSASRRKRAAAGK
jgi:hypothetical protein